MKTTHWSMTAAALLLALAPWMAVCIRADEAEDKAVKAIKKLGGELTRDETAKDKPIVSVTLVGTNVTNTGLKELGGLKQRQTLTLSYTEVRDEGLKELGGLKQLRTLDLSRTKVTDAGLKHLAGLKKLQTLGLFGTQVTDAGLEH